MPAAVPLVKFAVTDTFDELPVRAMVQAPVPVQGPLHPPKADPLEGTASRVTEVPPANEAVHVVPQLMPTGLLVTVPVPVPEVVTCNCACVCAKTTVTASLPFMATEQPALPEQAPPHDCSAQPAAGVAVRATLEPVAKGALQLVPQLMP